MEGSSVFLLLRLRERAAQASNLNISSMVCHICIPLVITNLVSFGRPQAPLVHKAILRLSCENATRQVQTTNIFIYYNYNRVFDVHLQVLTEVLHVERHHRHGIYIGCPTKTYRAHSTLKDFNASCLF